MSIVSQRLRRTRYLGISALSLGMGLASVVAGCQTRQSGTDETDSAFLKKQELLFESTGGTTVVDVVDTKQLPVEVSATRESTRSSTGARAKRKASTEAATATSVKAGEILVTNSTDLNSTDNGLVTAGRDASGDADTGRESPSEVGESEDAPSEDASSLGNREALDEDSPLETGELETDKLRLDAESEKSPEEIGGLVHESIASGGVEDEFALCEGSVYMEEWSRNFDARWLAENGRLYKRRSDLNRALGEARSQEFLKLLFPALVGLDFDFPVVVNDDVIKWMQYFQTRGRKWFVTALRRAEDIVPQMKPVLEAHGLPKDLVFLSMIESGFNNRALSIARAAGPWQFMRATGKMYGLKINDFVDERRDPAKSTVAAAQYLTNLYIMFGDWHLATASYNAGEGRVKRALRGAESQDYFAVSEARRLPNETRNYVPKLMAAMIISKNPTKFGFDVAEGSRALKSRTVRVEKSVSLAELAQSISVNPSVLENLNPELRVGITPPARATEKGFYEVRVPDQSYDAAVAAIDSLPEASRVQRVAAKVRKAETVSHFARRNGITLASLQSTNPGLKAGTRLRRGQTLLVPVTLGSGSYEKMVNDADSKKKKKVNYARATRRLRGKSARARSQSEATRTNTVKTKSVIERRNKRR